MRRRLFLLATLLGLGLGALIPQPLVNGFEPDDSIFLHVGRPTDPVKLPLPFPGQLQPVYVGHHSKRFRRTEPQLQLVEGCGLPVDTGPKGYGQLVLSGDGNIATFICYPYSSSVDWAEATVALVGVVSSEGKANATTIAFNVTAGEELYSAITDDGTGVWIASSRGLFYLNESLLTNETTAVIVGTANGGAGRILTLPVYAPVPIFRGKPITGLSITVNPRFTGGGPIVQIPDPLLPFPAFLLVSSPLDGDPLALTTHPTQQPLPPPGTVVANPFSFLPRSSQSFYPTPFIFGDLGWARPDPPDVFRPIYGLSFILFPRGPDLFKAGPVNSSGVYPVPDKWFVMADQSVESHGTAVFHSSGVLERRLILDSQSDTLSASGVSLRTPNVIVHMQSTMYRKVDRDLPREALMTIYTNGPFDVLKHVYMFPEEDSAPDRALFLISYIPKHHKGRRRFTGYCPAPYSPALPPPPQVTPFATARPSPSATVTPSFTPSGLPSSAPGALGPKGIFVGPPLQSSDPSRVQLLALRIGTKGLGFTDQTTARPLFVDILTQSLTNISFAVTGTLPLPSKAGDGLMRACTGSYHTRHLTIRVDTTANTATLAAAVVSCFDAEADGRNNITILRPTLEQLSTGIPASFVERQRPLPLAVAASISADGFVDTRNVVSMLPACRYAEVTAIYRAPPFQPAFYVGTLALAGSPEEYVGKCGVRMVPVGNWRGTLDVELVGHREDVITDWNKTDNRENALPASLGVIGDGLAWSLPVQAAGMSMVFTRLFLWEPAEDNVACIGCEYLKGEEVNELFAPQPGGLLFNGIMALKRVPFPRMNGTIDLGGVHLLIVDTYARPDGVFDAFITHCVTIDKNQATAREGLLLTVNPPLKFSSRPLLVRLPGPPDDKPLLDLVVGDKGTLPTEGQGPPPYQNQKLRVMRTYWIHMYVVTGQTEDTPLSPKGNSLWRFTVNPPTNSEITGRWEKVLEFDCCESLTVSIDINTLVAPLATPSARPTTTPSPTAMPTASPPPFLAELRPIPALPAALTSGAVGGAAPQRANVSQALPPVSLQLFARGCFSKEKEALLNCSSTSSSGGAADRVVLVQSVMTVPCPSAATDGSLAPVMTDSGKLTVYPWRGGALAGAIAGDSSPLEIRCTLAAKSPDVAAAGFASASTTASLVLDHFAYRWPLWEDLVQFYPAADALFSSRYGVSWTNVFGSPAKAAAAATNPEIFSASLTQFLATMVAPKASSKSEANTGVFSATLTAAAQGIIVAEGALAEATRLWWGRTGAGASTPGLPAFTNGTTVSLNGAQLQTLWVTGLRNSSFSAGSPGTLLSFALPKIACGDPAYVNKFGRCGYATLTISQPSLPMSLPASPALPQAFDLPCPPACPGAIDSAVAAPFVGYSPAQPTPSAAPAVAVLQSSAEASPSHAAASWSVYVAGFDATGAAAAMKRHPSLLSSLPQEHAPLRDPFTGGTSAIGINIAQACPGFTDPSFEKACTNASHPLFSQCAFGDGMARACQPCPANAVCPGGVRAQPFPRYWTPAETTGLIVPCAPPSDLRCLRWSNALGATECGAAYQQGSWGCLECREGSFPDINSETGCTACKPGDPYVQILVRFISVLAAVIGMAIGFFLVLLALAKSLGSTLEKSVARFLDLLLFFVLLMQMLSEVSSTATAGLPPGLQSLYNFLSAFNLQGVAIHSNCLAGIPPFLSETMSFASVILLEAAFLWFLWHEGRVARLWTAIKVEAKRGWENFKNSCRACCAPSTSTISSSSAVVTVTNAASTASKNDGKEKEKAKEPKKEEQVAPFSASADQATACCCGPLVSRPPPKGKAAAACHRFLASLSKPSNAGLIARVICLALAALYSRTSRTTFIALDCFPASLSLPQYANLNGVTNAMIGEARAAAEKADPAAAAAGLGTVQVELLRLNPTYLCNYGDHASVAGLAWFTLFFYLLGFPALTFFASLGAYGIERRYEETNGSAATAASVRTSGDDAETSKVFPPSRFPAITFLLRNTYRSARFYFRQLEMSLLFLLSLISVFWKQASSEAAFAWRGAITCALAATIVILLFRVSPYPSFEAWRVPLRAFSGVLSCLIAIINSLHSTSQLPSVAGTEKGASLATSVERLGIFLITLVFLYLLLISFFVGRSLIVGAKAEARALALQRKMEMQLKMAKRAVSRDKLRGLSRKGSAGGADEVEEEDEAIDYVDRSKVGRGKAGRGVEPFDLVDEKASARRYIGPPVAINQVRGGAFAFASEHGQPPAQESSTLTRAILAGYQPHLHSPSSLSSAGLAAAGGRPEDVEFDDAAGSTLDFQTANPIGNAASGSATTTNNGNGSSGVRRGSALSKLLL